MADAGVQAAFTLTAEDAAAELPLGVVPATPGAAEVSVARIVNPAGEAFSVQLILIRPPDAVTVGSFTPFPPDRAGVFLVAISPPARQLLDQRDPATRLRVSLVPLVPDRELPAPLAVEIRAPVWRAP